MTVMRLIADCELEESDFLYGEIPYSQFEALIEDFIAQNQPYSKENIFLSLGVNWDRPVINVTLKREETEDEKSARLMAEARRERHAEAIEREQYLRLKAKFEGDNKEI